MKTIEINGISATNFGSNNYSHGMEGLVFNAKTTSIEQVKLLPGVFLHPTVKPNESEIFAVLGTQEQFDLFYNSCKSSYAAKEAFAKFGMPNYDDRDSWGKLHVYEEELEASFKAWYE